MAKASSGVKWKEVDFGVNRTNKYRLEVSNQGQLRAFNQFSNGDTLPGSTINGYRIIRLKLYKPKNKNTKAEHLSMHAGIVALRSKKKILVSAGASKVTLAQTNALLEKKTSQLREAKKTDIKERTIHYHALIHRLVAEYFVKPKSANHTVVAHIDFNKLNNAASNLRWMTKEENYAHQQLSPLVIRSRKARLSKSKASKGLAKKNKS